MENNHTNIEQYEQQFHDAEITRLKKRVEELSLRVEFYKSLENKIFSILSQKLNQNITAANIDNIEIQDSLWGEVMDDALDQKDNLIRYSHSIMPYSIIQKEPELEELIPIQNPKYPLEILNDKSVTRAFELRNEFTSENTKLAYQGDLIYWQAWLEAIKNDFSKPINENHLLKFIVEHAEGKIDKDVDIKLVQQRYKNKKGPHKLSTVKRRVAALSVFLDKAKWPNPCRNTAIKELLDKLTKIYGGSKPAGKAITKDVLDDMLDTCYSEKLIDTRDKALLLFAWASGGRRRSEVVSAEVENLEKTPEGDFVYKIPKSKVDQKGEGHFVPIKGRAAMALEEWITKSEITSGRIFRSIDKSGTLIPLTKLVRIRKGKTLSYVLGHLVTNDVYCIVKKRLKKAGYDESHYTAHSLRSGFVTEAGRRGKPIGDVMQMTTHKSVTTVMKYYHAGNVINNSAANLSD